VQNGLNKCFEARWLLEDDCEDVVKAGWNEASSRGATNTMEYLK
jgi:hypothetical protein